MFHIFQNLSSSSQSSLSPDSPISIFDGAQVRSPSLKPKSSKDAKMYSFTHLTIYQLTICKQTSQFVNKHLSDLMYISTSEQVLAHFSLIFPLYWGHVIYQRNKKTQLMIKAIRFCYGTAFIFFCNSLKNRNSLKNQTILQ